MSWRINVINTSDNIKEKFKYTDFVESKKSELWDALSSPEQIMEDYWISKYELSLLMKFWISDDDALNALTKIKENKWKRDIDILMNHWVYEDIALKTLAKMKKKSKYNDKINILKKAKTDKHTKLWYYEAVTILDEIENEKEKQSNRETENLKYLINLWIEENEAIKILNKINKLSKVNRNILDNFAIYSWVDEDKALDIVERINQCENDKDKLNILWATENIIQLANDDKNVNERKIRDGAYKILESIKEDENNKFSAERHWKPEKDYSDVFPEYFWDTLSLYEKEKRARKIDYVQKDVVCDENVKIRVSPKWIRRLRKLLWVHDFKWWAYRWNTIYLSNTADIDNLRLLNHENIHGEQQRELWSKKLQKLAPWAPKLLWFFRRCVESFIKWPILWQFNHKDEKFDIEVLSTSVRTENEAYSNQWNIWYPNDREKKAYKKYLNPEVEKELYNRLMKDNYWLEIQSLNLDERLKNIISKIRKIIDNSLKSADWDTQKRLLDLKWRIDFAENNLNELSADNSNGIKKHETLKDLVEKYKSLISTIKWIINEEKTFKDTSNMTKKEKEERNSKIDDALKRDSTLHFGNLYEELENIEHDLIKNWEINKEFNTTDEIKLKRRTFNAVDKIIDTVCVIRTLEDKLEQLKELKNSWKKLDEFKPSEKLKKDIELYQNEIANENLTYMLEDEFTDMDLIEKTIKSLNQKCYKNEAAATDIRLEEKWHQEKSEKLADITVALMKYWINDNELSEIIEDIRKNNVVDFENRDWFEKYSINKFRFCDILKDIRVNGNDSLNNNYERKRELDETKKKKKENAPVIPTNFQTN